MKETEDRYLSSQEAIFFVAVVMMGLFLRFYGISSRPIHHDESLHGIYAYYFFIDSATMYYQYDPLLHGPFLYHLLPFFYFFFDVSKFAIRLPMALIGSFFIFIPILLRRYLKSEYMLALTAMIALSPTLVYWSRFVRHDPLVLLFISLIIIVYFSNISNNWKVTLITVFSILQFTIKENAYIHLSLILGYLIFTCILSRRIPAFSGLKNHWKGLLSGIVIGGFLYCYFFSAGFKYNRGILDGLYRKSLVYWAGQHHVERITGPFSFHFFNLAWYEHIFVILLVIYLFHFYWRCTKAARLSFVLVLVFSLILRLMFPAADGSFISTWLKIKMSTDFYFFFPLIFHSVFLTYRHWKSNEKGLAFFGYFFFASLFSYSYVGEKVPWLTLYPLVFGIIYLTLYFQSQFSSRKLVYIFTSILCLVSFGYSYYVNILHPGGAYEFISQVHTTPQYEKLGEKLKKELENPTTIPPYEVLAMEENVWPMSWWLYGYPEFVYIWKDKDPEKFKFILSPFPNPSLIEKLQGKYKIETLPLRWWWLPDYNQMTLWNFLKYSITHKPWNRPVSMNVLFFERY